MNSFSDKEFDDKLDRMLSDSVRPGAEPPDLTMIRVPQRPRFNWALFGGAVTGIVFAGALLFMWLIGGADEAAVARTVPGEDLWVMLSDSIIIGAGNLSSPGFLLYTAGVMAVIYYFFASRIIRFYRLH